MILEKTDRRLTTPDNIYKWKVLVTVSLFVTMATMDSSITNISFPILTRVFKADFSTVMWVTLAYVLVSTSLVLILGKISDVIGRKRIFCIGVCVFTLGLLACALAQSIGQLILFRSIQGIGSAMAISCSNAIITDVFPEKEMGRGLGILAVFVAVGLVSGPVVGGYLLDTFDWRSIFYVRIPVVFISVYMSIALLKKDRSRQEHIDLDIKGAVTSSVGLVCLIFGMSQVNKLGLDSPVVYLLIGFGIINLVAFIFIERHAKDPIVDLFLFKNSVFSSAIWSLCLSFVAYPVFVMLMPYYMMHGIGLSASVAGLLIGIHSIAHIIVSPVSGWLSDRYGPIWFAALGAVMSTVAFLLMRTFDLSTTTFTIGLVMVLFGMGVGIFTTPNNSIIMGEVPKNRLGTASALIATQRQIGMALGMAISGAIFSVRRATHAAELAVKGYDPHNANSLSISMGFHDVILVSVIIGILVVIISVLPAFRRHEVPKAATDIAS